MYVWYAAYGSNLLRERLLAYLRGGPVPGRPGRLQHGARDAADPVDSRPYHIDRAMLFAGNSAGWGGGGVSFVHSGDVVEGDTFGRAWLLTSEQLADVWAQEAGGTVGPELDLEALARDGSADFGRGRYRRLDYLGQLDGRPVATITCEEAPEHNVGAAAYMQVVGRGLIEAWEMSVSEAAEYLASRQGNAGSLDAADLARRLSGPGSLGV